MDDGSMLDRTENQNSTKENLVSQNPSQLQDHKVST